MMITENQQYVDHNGQVGRIKKVISTGTFFPYNNPLASQPAALIEDILGQELVLIESSGAPWEPSNNIISTKKKK